MLEPEPSGRKGRPQPWQDEERQARPALPVESVPGSAQKIVEMRERVRQGFDATGPGDVRPNTFVQLEGRYLLVIEVDGRRWLVSELDEVLTANADREAARQQTAAVRQKLDRSQRLLKRAQEQEEAVRADLAALAAQLAAAREETRQARGRLARARKRRRRAETALPPCNPPPLSSQLAGDVTGYNNGYGGSRMAVHVLDNGEVRCDSVKEAFEMRQMILNGTGNGHAARPLPATTSVGFDRPHPLPPPKAGGKFKGKPKAKKVKAGGFKAFWEALRPEARVFLKTLVGHPDGLDTPALAAQLNWPAGSMKATVRHLRHAAAAWGAGEVLVREDVKVDGAKASKYRLTPEAAVEMAGL